MRVEGAGFKVEGAGFRVQGCEQLADPLLLLLVRHQRLPLDRLRPVLN